MIAYVLAEPFLLHRAQCGFICSLPGRSRPCVSFAITAGEWA